MDRCKSNVNKVVHTRDVSGPLTRISIIPIRICAEITINQVVKDICKASQHKPLHLMSSEGHERTDVLWLN